MEGTSGKIHFIVAPSLWQGDPIKYRRHRLALFLLNRPDTGAVIWIAPTEGRLSEIAREPRQERLDNGIVQITVYDFQGIVRNGLIPPKHLLKYVLEQKKAWGKYAFYLWYTYPAYGQLARAGVWQKVTYDCSDLWANAHHSRIKTLNAIKSRMIAHTEKKIVRSADRCFASSRYLAAHLSSLKPGAGILVENGVDFSLFHKRSFPLGNRTISQDRPVLGFVGGLKSWKIDFQLLLEVVTHRRDWDLVLVGEPYGEVSPELSQLLRQPNVRLHHTVPADEIPSIMSSFDVGIIPYLSNKYTKGVFPLKLFEYLASGLPVVGCGVPSTKDYCAEGVYEHTANDPSEFVKACEKAIDCRWDSQKMEMRFALAKEADWQKKLATFMDEL